MSFLAKKKKLVAKGKMLFFIFLNFLFHLHILYGDAFFILISICAFASFFITLPRGLSIILIFSKIHLLFLLILSMVFLFSFH